MHQQISYLPAHYPNFFPLVGCFLDGVDVAAGAARAKRALAIRPVLCSISLWAAWRFLPAAEISFKLDHLDVRTSGKGGHLVHGGAAEP